MCIFFGPASGNAASVLRKFLGCWNRVSNFFLCLCALRACRARRNKTATSNPERGKSSLRTSFLEQCNFEYAGIESDETKLCECLLLCPCALSASWACGDKIEKSLPEKKNGVCKKSHPRESSKSRFRQKSHPREKSKSEFRKKSHR